MILRAAYRIGIILYVEGNTGIQAERSLIALAVLGIAVLIDNLIHRFR
jgi:hypothetical protein